MICSLYFYITILKVSHSFLLHLLFPNYIVILSYLNLFPIYQPQFRDDDLERKDLQKKVSISWILDRNTKDYLIHSFGFTTAEIKQNISLFERAVKEINLIQFMSIIKEKVRTKNIKNPKGYLINAIKKELKI